MGKPAFAEGDVVPLYVRVRGIYREQGIATVRISAPGYEPSSMTAWGGGFEQKVVRLDSLGKAILPEFLSGIVVPFLTW